MLKRIVIGSIACLLFIALIVSIAEPTSVVYAPGGRLPEVAASSAQAPRSLATFREWLQRIALVALIVGCAWLAFRSREGRARILAAARGAVTAILAYMRRFARRSAIVMAGYAALMAILWGLSLLVSWLRLSSNPVIGVVALLVLLLPLILFAWALTGKSYLTPFVAGAVLVALFVLSVVGTLTLLAIFGPPTEPSPEDEIADVFILLFGLMKLAVFYVPLLGLGLGTIIHFTRYPLGRVVVPIVVLAGIGWFLGPTLTSNVLPRIQDFTCRTVGLKPTDYPSIPHTIAVLTPEEAEGVTLLEQYLTSQYNAELGLYRESPNTAPNRYWVYTDSYLAGADVARWQVSAPKIWTVFVEHAVVDEVTLTYEQPARDLRDNVSTKYDNQYKRLRDWQEYADRVLLAAVNARNRGDECRFGELMAIGNRMWDGKGLRDKAFRTEKYETYKTALYYYLTGNPTARDVLLGLQEHDRQSNRFGGVYPKYGDDLRPLPGLDTHTETSAIVLRALREHPVDRDKVATVPALGDRGPTVLPTAALVTPATSTSVAPVAPTLEATPVAPRASVSPVPIPPPVQSHAMGDSEAIALLERYLSASYDPAVGLYREAPNVAPTTYWVYSDGYLGGLDISKWNVPVLTKWTVLVDKAVVPEETFTYRHRDIDLGNGVRSEAHDTDPPRLNDWQEYADRVLLAAINARNAQNRQREAELMKVADAMWNGKGMDDKFHRVQGHYQTYHVALYYFMTGNPKAREILLRLQERDPKSNRYGGIYTEYGEDGGPLPGTDTNIETTAIVLRALLRHATP